MQVDKIREDILMNFKKKPETEKEFYEIIRYIEKVVGGIKSDASSERITKEIAERKIKRYKDLLEVLFSALGLRYNIVFPENFSSKNEDMATMPNAPSGKIWYQDWYRKMKIECRKTEYEGIICSACPLSEGAEAFASGKYIPCIPWGAGLCSLGKPHECAMISPPQFRWKREELLAEIRKTGGGEEAVKKFERKEATLFC